eukprot:scaffold75_cov165-Amphora_coffeaeformis.AAC.26
MDKDDKNMEKIKTTMRAEAATIPVTLCLIDLDHAIISVTFSTDKVSRHVPPSSQYHYYRSVIIAIEQQRTMSELTTEEEYTAKIGELGDQIKAAKTAKKPNEEWDPILKEMLALKAQFKTKFGKDFGPPPKEKKPIEPEQQAPAKELSEEERLKKEQKKEQKRKEKEEKEKKKKAQQDERKRREEEKAAKLAGLGQENFGDAPLVQSQAKTDKVWTPIRDLKPNLAGKQVLVRGHLQTARAVGKMVFVLIRSALYSVQGIAMETKDGRISQAMIKYIAGLPAESVVDIGGVVTVPDQPVDSATQKMVEIHISSLHCMVKARLALPFQMEDACRPESGLETDVGEYNEEDGAPEGEDGVIRVGQKMRLDYRWLDLRTPANQAIFRIESMVGCLFRECLMKKGFVEIHTPKLIGGASEGGSDVFTCKEELERVREQHPFEDLKYLRPTLKLTFAEGCALLREAGIEQGDYEDLSTTNEKKLGDIVKKKYGTDFYFMDKYPLAVRPFYTMPDPNNPKLSNSYDFFIRGQEIVSGAQRIHDPDLLEERATAHGIPLDDIKAYVDSFRHGAQPHGGGGIGLERVVMLFLGLPNIRKTAWFPRTPKRIAP